MKSFYKIALFQFFLMFLLVGEIHFYQGLYKNVFPQEIFLNSNTPSFKYSIVSSKLLVILEDDEDEDSNENDYDIKFKKSIFNASPFYYSENKYILDNAYAFSDLSFYLSRSDRSPPRFS